MTPLTPAQLFLDYLCDKEVLLATDYEIENGATQQTVIFRDESTVKTVVDFILRIGAHKLHLCGTPFQNKIYFWEPQMRYNPEAPMPEVKWREIIAPIDPIVNTIIPYSYHV